MRQVGQSKKMAEARLSFEERKTITILIHCFPFLKCQGQCSFMIYQLILLIMGIVSDKSFIENQTHTFYVQKLFPKVVPLNGVPRGVWGFKLPPKFRSFDKAESNSQFRGIYIRNNLIRIRFHSFANWVEPLIRGLPLPDRRSLCPLSSTEFFEPSGVPRNFFRGGFNKFSWGQRAERRGIWGH
jgi:hypothetical protein